LAVRHSVRSRLRYADVVAWFAQRGLVVDRSILSRWVQRFLPVFQHAARVHRRPVGTQWRVDEPFPGVNGPWTYIYRAIDEDGQVVDASFSTRRTATAGYPLGEAFFEGAMDETSVRPTRVTTATATCYPPTLRTVLPMVEHRHSRYLNNEVERDHGHLKQRLYPMRGFTRAASADTLARGHARIRNLRNGFSTRTMCVVAHFRLAVAWPQLARIIEPGAPLCMLADHGQGAP
jgi:transposase-like protein